MCDALYSDGTDLHSSKNICLNNYIDCTEFMGGILMKGLYSANVAYWDNMRSMANDFNNSVRNFETALDLMVSNRMIDNERLKDTYFSISYQ